MRKIILLLFIIACALQGQSQVSYHYYYDSTTQWRIYYGGVVPGSGGWWSTYYTTYFDGDTLIGTQWYYRVYILQLDSSDCGPFASPGCIYVDTVLSGPSFEREDSSHKIWQFNPKTGKDVLVDDYGTMPIVGDTFQYSNCTVGSIDSLYLGSFPLKRVRPPNNIDSMSWTRGIVEGIGNTFSPCGMGVEANVLTVCFSSLGGKTVLLSHLIPCSKFLDPVYTHQHSNDSVGNNDSTSIPTIVVQSSRSQVRIFPNPAKASLSVVLPQRTRFDLVISDQLGRRLIQSKSLVEQITVDISILPKGIYYLTVTSNNFRQCEKFVKD